MLDAMAVLDLQRALGNRAVCGLLESWTEPRVSGPRTEPLSVIQRIDPGLELTVDGKPETDEGVSAELSDSPTGPSSEHRVKAWLRNHKDEIADLEAQFGVDRRAIAGAVAWEALQNVKSQAAMTFGRFLGAGKVHVKSSLLVPASIHTGENLPEESERAALLPKRTLAQREEIIKKDSLPYIAAGMRLGSDIAEKHGLHIDSDPAMLTWFWNTSDAKKFEDHLAKKKRGEKLNPTAERMPRWVIENLAWIEDAVGKPALR